MFISNKSINKLHLLYGSNFLKTKTKNVAHVCCRRCMWKRTIKKICVQRRSYFCVTTVKGTEYGTWRKQTGLELFSAGLFNWTGVHSILTQQPWSLGGSWKHKSHIWISWQVYPIPMGYTKKYPKCQIPS